MKTENKMISLYLSPFFSLLRSSLCFVLLPICVSLPLLGWVESPGYPRGYPPDASLNWSRRAPHGHTLSLTLTHLDLEDSEKCEHDALEIVADGSKLSSLCGRMSLEELQSTINPSLNSLPGGSLSISFYSDYSNVERHTGFRGFYTVQDVDECLDPENGCTHFCINYIGGYRCSCPYGYILDTNNQVCKVNCTEDRNGSEEGSVSSPGHPNPYGENSQCSYTLSVDDGKQIVLEFTPEFDVEQGEDGQCVDSLTVKTSTARFGPFCGRVPPPSLATGSHQVEVVFVTDGSGINIGFTLNYKTTVKTCPAVVTSNSTLNPEHSYYNYNDKVIVTCEPGSAVNTDTITDPTYTSICQKTGVWSPVYECEPVDCGYPDIPEDSLLQLTVENPSTIYQDEIQFKCESKYYTLVGEEMYRCADNGNWLSRGGKADWPQCEPVCGKPEPEDFEHYGRIFGGTKVKLGTIPWQLNINLQGGASLIDDRWAITAAHVVQGMVKENLRLYGGLIDTNNLTDNQIKIDKIFIHPEYKGKKTSFDNDIALIKISSRVKLRSTILPICLPKVKTALNANDEGTISGWGGTNNTKRSSILLSATVKVYNQETCSDTPKHKDKSYIFTDNMFCAGERGTDSCNGDSGGPFFMPPLGYTDGPFTLRGLVSWGEPCSVKSNKGYYTKVDNYIDWINKTMKDEEEDGLI